MIKVLDLIQKIQKYHPKADVDLINKAYVFSAKAHEGQVRKCGEPYVTHPLEVANILADMKMDVQAIVAGILHDTIEDTEVTKEEIGRIFGPDISQLVDGVTKLSKLEIQTREDRQAENYRKMILAMSKDIRVILIKLADRLHNMSTLQFMSEEKQMKIARETLDIYAPIANRLGIQWIKLQLEDLSFRFTKPNLFKQLEKKLGRLRKNREDYMGRVEAEVKKVLKSMESDFVFSGRMKNIFGIYRKMETQNINFEEVHDLIAFRILVDTVEECYEALGLLHSLWKPVSGRFKDYIAMPKPNNYQSLHTTVICLDGERVEFQIRTKQMHAVAEEGIAAHWEYKESGSIDTKESRTFRWLRQLVSWQDELKDSLEYLDTVKVDLYATDVFIFTPKGDVRTLPHGSTPIDFAYSIHSAVGDHCSGAKINGRMVPLSTQLESGDSVEVLTSPQSHPTRDWLKMVGSSRAKARIRHYIKQEQQSKSTELGRSLFIQECEKRGLKPDEVMKSEAFKDLLDKKSLQNESSFYSAVGYGKVSLPVWLDPIAPRSDVKEDGLIRRIFKKVTQRSKNAVIVDGIEDMLITYGKCCLPIPGDSIVGFVSRGRGVTLHRAECPKVPSIDVNRRVKTQWNKSAQLTRSACLIINCDDKPGMLASITHVISEEKVNITRVLVRTDKDKKAHIYMDVLVSNVSELNRIMSQVEKISGVISTQRQVA